MTDKEKLAIDTCIGILKGVANRNPGDYADMINLGIKLIDESVYALKPKFKIGDTIKVKTMECHGKLFIGDPHKILAITDTEYVLDDGKSYSIKLQDGWELVASNEVDQIIADSKQLIKNADNCLNEIKAIKEGVAFLLNEYKTNKRYFREEPGHVTTADVIKTTFEFGWASKRNYDYDHKETGESLGIPDIKASFYPKVKEELESLGFTELLNTFEQFHTDHWSIFIKQSEEFGSYQICMLFFNASGQLIRSVTTNNAKSHFHNLNK